MVSNNTGTLDAVPLLQKFWPSCVKFSSLVHRPFSSPSGAAAHWRKNAHIFLITMQNLMIFFPEVHNYVPVAVMPQKVYLSHGKVV
jgi:hypothetical protein